jgi:hypothetical protein
MQQSTISPDRRELLRRKIVPFGRPPDQLTFGVGWHTEALTFETIVDTLRPQIIKDLLYFKKMARKHIADLLQQGWLRLWQALHENADLLVTMSQRKAADFVCNRCGSTTLHDYLKRYTSYHQLSKWDESGADDYEESITEIVIGSSLKSSGRGRHALFARTVDKLIDIEAAMRQVAEWCMDDIRKLAALYYLTTSVSQKDAGQIAGFPVFKTKQGRLRCRGIQYWTRVVLQRLREVFALYKPFEPNLNAWRECLKAGDTEPVLMLAERYADDAFKLLALYTLTTRVARDTVVRELGVDDSKLWYAMKRLRQELRCLYARRDLGRA